MKLVVRTAALLAACGLAAAAPGAVSKWTVYDVCHDDCSLAGVAMPDQNTFQLPLEGFFLEQCPPTVVGPFDAPLSTSRVCLTFSGPALHFNFEPFPGYDIKSAVVTWKVMGNIGDASSTWSTPRFTTNIPCASAPGGAYACTLPFSDILGVSLATAIAELMQGICPKGDREALGFCLQFSGLAEPVGGGPPSPLCSSIHARLGLATADARRSRLSTPSSRSPTAAPTATQPPAQQARPPLRPRRPPPAPRRPTRVSSERPLATRTRWTASRSR